MQIRISVWSNFDYMLRDSSDIYCCIYNNEILNLKKRVTPAISHVSQITWLDTDLAFRRRDMTKTTTGATPTPQPPAKQHHTQIEFFKCLHNIQYVKGHKIKSNSSSLTVFTAIFHSYAESCFCRDEQGRLL